MRNPAASALNGVIDYAAFAVAGAALQRAPIPGLARVVGTPLLVRAVRSARGRKVLLGLAAVGLVAMLIADWPDGDDSAEEWDEPY